MVLFDEACDSVLERFKLKNLKYLQRKGAVARPLPPPSYAYDVLIANCRSPRPKNVHIYYINNTNELKPGKERNK